MKERIIKKKRIKIMIWIMMIITTILMKVKASSNYGVIGFGFDTSSNELLFTPTSPFSVQVNLNKTLEKIAAGKTHYITIENTNTRNMLGWGENQNGQIGLNISSTVASLDTLPLDAKIIKACAGDGYTIAISNDNKVYSWGTGTTGQLGTGATVTSRLKPEQITQTGVLATKTISDVACGVGHVLLLNTDQTIAAFGLGTNGQLGNDATTNQFVAVMVAQLGNKYTHIAAGGYHSLAISRVSSTQNVVYSFGKGTEGQLGRASSDSDSRIPQACYTSVGSDLTTNIKAIAAGKYASAALTHDGKIITWGQNTKLVLGHASGTTAVDAKQPYPLQVDMSGALASKQFKGIYINSESYHMVAIDENEIVYTWGDNTRGQLGYDQSISTQSVPIVLPVTGVPRRRLIKEIKTNEVSTLLLSDDSIIYQTGGYLPTFYTSEKSMFGYANENVFKNQYDNLVRLALGDAFAVLIDPSRNLWSWGSNGNLGLLGIGKNTDDADSAYFQQINTTAFLATGDYPIEIASGLYHSVVLSNNGELYSWGDNGQAQLGISSVSGFRSKPTKVNQQAMISKATAICANSKYTIILDAQGYIFSFGFNPNGELAQVDGGDTEVVLAASPQAVKNASTGTKPSSLANVLIKDISCGTKHVLAISTTGIIHAWGDNSAKQLGVLTTIDDSPGSKSVVPILVNTTGNALTGVEIIQIAAGLSHSVALASNGKLLSWGSNVYNQLGISSLEATTYYYAQEVTLTGTPLQGKPIDDLHCGDDFTLVLSNDKKLYSFGRNNLNQLGNANYRNSPTPVEVLDGQGQVMTNVTNGIASFGTLTVLIVDNGFPICYGVAPDVTCSQHGTCVQQNNCSCHDLYYGDQCEHFTCNGKNESDTTVCSSNGICRSAESCDCYSRFWGSDCQHFLCYSKTSDACNLQGQCTAFDTCVCNSTYTGPECQYPFCFGIPSNDSQVCGQQGECTLPNTCKCNSTHIGPDCKIPLCYDIGQNESHVCSGHGVCNSPNNCTCASGFTGDSCEQPICYSIRSGNSSVCSSHGSCVNVNNCSCSTGYTGTDCSIPICFDILATNTSSVCFGKGTCREANTCDCQANAFGPQCNLVKCNSILSNESTVCSGHGVCNATDSCQCSSTYTNTNCETPICFSIAGNSGLVCSSHGTCQSPDVCACQTGYTGQQCQVSVCFNVFSNDTTVCSSHGNCTAYDTCACRGGHYSGNQCQTINDEANSCFGFAKDDHGFVCSGHGTCVSKDSCSCQPTWFNEKCDTQTCFGIFANESSVCNGHGNCTGPDVCQCEPGYGDSSCNSITCFGVPASLATVCSGHGTCTAFDRCSCHANDANGYWDSSNCSVCDAFHSGSECKTASCTNAVSCSGHGTCAADQLSCNCLSTTTDGFFNGTQCTTCADYYLNYPTCTEKCVAESTCSNNGICLTSGACRCHQTIDAGFFTGNNCSTCTSPYRGTTKCQTNFVYATVSFNDDGTHLILSNGTYPVTTLCELIVSSLSKIGKYPICSVNNTQKIISILLGNNATIVPHQNLSILEEPGSTTTIDFIVKPPTEPTKPTADFYTKPSIGKCESMFLDGSLSTSKDGRALTYQWSSTTAGFSTHLINQPTITIPDSALSPGTYQFSMQATTFLNASSSVTTKSVTVLSNVVPVPSIKGGSTYSIALGKTLTLEGLVTSSCTSENFAGTLSYKWRSLSGPTNIDAKLSSTTTTLSLDFSTAGIYQLEFVVTTDAIAGHEFTKRIVITAQNRPLVAIIDGESRVMPASQILSLKGDSSFDPDAPTSFTYTFEWSCFDETTKVDCTNMITNKFISTTDIGANRLVNGRVYTIRLTYSDGVSRTAMDSVSIETDANAGLLVSLKSIATRVNANEELSISSSTMDLATSATVPLNSKDFTYTWTIQKDSTINQTLSSEMLVTSTSNLPQITFKKHSLIPGSTYTLLVSVNKISTNAQGKAWLKFVVNIPPQQGQFTIHPESIKSIEDSFTAIVTQWTDPEKDTPLQYRLSYVHPTTNEKNYLTMKTLESSFNLKFPVISFKDTLRVSVSVDVFDQLGALSTLTQQIQVAPIGTSRADVLVEVEKDLNDLDNSLSSLTFSEELQRLLLIAQNLVSHESRFCETSCSSSGTCNRDVTPHVCVCQSNIAGRDCSLPASTKSFAIALKERAALLFSKVVQENTESYSNDDANVIVQIAHLLSKDTDEVTQVTYTQISSVYNKTLTEQPIHDQDDNLSLLMPELLNNLMESILNIVSINGTSVCQAVGTTPLEMFLEKTMSYLSQKQALGEVPSLFKASALSIHTYKNDFTSLVAYKSHLDASSVQNVYVNHSSIELPSTDLSSFLAYTGSIDLNYAVLQVNPFPCSDYPANSTHISDFVFIGFYDSGNKLTNVKNLPNSIVFTVPLNVESLIPTAEQVLTSDTNTTTTTYTYTCRYYTGSAWSTEGCQFLSTNSTHGLCSCDHTTVYSLFIDSTTTITFPEPPYLMYAMIALGILLALCLCWCLCIICCICFVCCLRRRFKTHPLDYDSDTDSFASERWLHPWEYEKRGIPYFMRKPDPSGKKYQFKIVSGEIEETPYHQVDLSSEGAALSDVSMEGSGEFLIKPEHKNPDNLRELSSTPDLAAGDSATPTPVSYVTPMDDDHFSEDEGDFSQQEAV